MLLKLDARGKRTRAHQTGDEQARPGAEPSAVAGQEVVVAHIPIERIVVELHSGWLVPCFAGVARDLFGSTFDRLPCHEVAQAGPNHRSSTPCHS